MPAQYQTATGRVLSVLQSACADGPAVISNRQIAAAASCSPGGVPAILRRLEGEGLIERVDGVINLLIGGDQIIDRGDQFFDQGGDQGIDQGDQIIDRDQKIDHLPSGAIQGIPVQQTASDQEIDQGGDQKIDQNACKVLRHDLDQQQLASYAHACVSDQLPESDLVVALRRAGATPSVIHRILQACPSRTLAEYEQQLAWATANPRNTRPKAVLFAAWQRGEAIEPYQKPPEQPSKAPEVSHGRRYAPPNQSFRSAAAQAFGKWSDADMAKIRAYRAAMEAEQQPAGGSS